MTMFGLGRPQTPSIAWTGNQKQRYRAARTRARKRGHFTRLSEIPFNPLRQTGERWSFRCSCRESGQFRTAEEQILAERAHVMKVGAR